MQVVEGCQCRDAGYRLSTPSTKYHITMCSISILQPSTDPRQVNERSKSTVQFTLRCAWLAIIKIEVSIPPNHEQTPEAVNLFSFSQLHKSWPLIQTERRCRIAKLASQHYDQQFSPHHRFTQWTGHTGERTDAPPQPL